MVAPKIGDYKKENIIINNTVPATNGLVFCNMSGVSGEQFSFFTTGGGRYFRYSFTKNAWFFGKKVWNLQFGSNEVRYIYKNKFRTI